MRSCRTPGGGGGRVRKQRKGLTGAYRIEAPETRLPGALSREEGERGRVATKKLQSYNAPS